MNKVSVSLLYSGWFLINAVSSSFFVWFSKLASQLGMNGILIGIVFSALPIGSILCSIISSQYLTARGWDKHRSKTTSLGLFLSAISLLPLIFLLDLENKSKEKENNSTTSMSASVLLIIGSFASRLTIGAGSSLFSLSAFGYLQQMKTISLEQLSSNMEGMNGIGTVLGPFIYAFILSFSHSEIIPFLVFLVVLLVNAIVFLVWVPKQQRTTKTIYSTFNSIALINQEILNGTNNSQEEGGLSVIEEQDDEEYTINYKDIFNDRELVLCVLCIMMPSSSLLFIDSSIGVLLQDQLNLSVLSIGIVYSSGTAAYFFFQPIIFKFIRFNQQTYRDSHEISLFFGSILSSVAFFIFPSIYEFLKDNFQSSHPTAMSQLLNILLPSLANAFLAITTILIFSPAMPLLFQRLGNKYPELPSTIICDFASVLYHMSYAIGELVGPFIGAIFTQVLSFERTTRIYGIVIFICSFIHIILIKIQKIYNNYSGFTVEQQYYSLNTSQLLLNQSFWKKPFSSARITGNIMVSSDLPKFQSIALRPKNLGLFSHQPNPPPDKTNEFLQKFLENKQRNLNNSYNTLELPLIRQTVSIHIK